MPETFYFYILRCRDNTLYCGQTNDLEKRLKQHNEDNKKGAKYTKGRRPVALVYSEVFSTLKAARSREAEVKKLTKGKKEVLVKGNK